MKYSIEVEETFPVIDDILVKSKLTIQEGIECSGIGATIDTDLMVRSIKFCDNPEVDYSPRLLKAVLQYFEKEIASQKIICGGIASEGFTEVDGVKHSAIIITMLYCKSDKMITYIVPYKRFVESKEVYLMEEQASVDYIDISFG